MVERAMRARGAANARRVLPQVLTRRTGAQATRGGLVPELGDEAEHSPDELFELRERKLVGRLEQRLS